MALHSVNFVAVSSLRCDSAEKIMGLAVLLQVKTNRPFYKAILSIGTAVIVVAVVIIGPAFSEGRIYEGSEEKAHCSLWDNLRLKWPQTILGREKAKCRRKATPPTQVSNI